MSIAAGVERLNPSGAERLDVEAECEKAAIDVS